MNIKAFEKADKIIREINYLEVQRKKTEKFPCGGNVYLGNYGVDVTVEIKEIDPTGILQETIKTLIAAQIEKRLAELRKDFKEL